MEYRVLGIWRSRASCYPYGYGVVFTNITRAQWNKQVPEDIQDQALPPHRVILKDEMTENAEAEDFQACLWGMFEYSFGDKLSLPKIDRIRWMLFPEVRINAPQQELFSDAEDGAEPARPAFVDAIPEIVRVMDIQQEQLAKSLGEGHRGIHGVAGFGKTLILGYRCLHLAKAVGKPILVLCFNITLAARLRSFIVKKAIEDKVQVYHFHEWCGRQLKTYNVKTLEDDRPLWERQVESVIQGVEQGQIPRAQYGALMIDEGHDVEQEWLKPESVDLNPKLPAPTKLVLSSGPPVSFWSGLSWISLRFPGVIAEQAFSTLFGQSVRPGTSVPAYRF